MRLALSFLIALAGVALTLQTIVLMNRFVNPVQDSLTSAVVNFSVPQVKTAPPPPPERPRSTPRATERSLAPLPDLGIGGSPVTVDVPDYAQGNLGAADASLLGKTDDVAMTADTVDKPPVVRRSPLAYPDKARQRGITGRVTVSILVGVDGRVQKSKVLDATPAGVFDQAVLEALPQWVFAPAEYQGRPVPIWVTLPLDFAP